jgi:biofilm PGA synthesis N-glycosyltransferase PgaC
MSDPFINYMVEYIFAYPFIMSIIWVFGALLFIYVSEKDFQGPEYCPKLEFYPFVSIVVPCHNESENIRETIAHLLRLNYPHYEIIAVNDGSTDDTAIILNELASENSQVRAVHLKHNRGKQTAQRMGALMSNGDILVCMDGDALFEPNSVTWLVRRLLLHNNIGGVTGNPRIRNRSSLLGKLQVGEFSSIIGLIKRSQMDLARLFTVSGVICAFKKSALHDVGYWRTDMITDDIDITWRLQKSGWLIMFQPNAICWILMPETVKGLWKQRLRWAKGGAEIIRTYGLEIISKPGLRMLPLFIDYVLSILWANILFIVIVLEILYRVGLSSFEVNLLVPTHWGITLTSVFLIQAIVSFLIDRKYERGLFSLFPWMIWYPAMYWVINAATSFWGFYKAFFTKKSKFAVWTSPDRGLK